MRFGIFDKFGALNSPPVFDAFCRGLDRLGYSYASHDMSADIAVIWSVVWAGRMRPNQAVWQTFRKSKRPVIVLEVGMLDRGRTWKVGINGTGSGCFGRQELDPMRVEKLGLKTQTWTNTGQHIVIATQRSDSLQWAGLPSTADWLQNTVDRLRCYTDRPIRVRPHPRQRVTVPRGCEIDTPTKMADTYDDFDFGRSLKNAWAVINHNSGIGSQSIIAGVPAFVDNSSLAAPVANLDLKNIEDPARPDRDQWLLEIAHTEWTTEEIAAGRPLQRLISTH